MHFNIFSTYEDKNFEGMFRPFLGGHSSKFFYQQPATIAAALADCDAVLTTNPAFVKKLTGKSSVDHEDYYGSFWQKRSLQGKEIPIVCLPPLDHIVKTKPGPFMFRRYLSKILTPADWFKPTKFTWSLCDDLISMSAAFDILSRCRAIASDIETSPAYARPDIKENPRHVITCVGYSGIAFASDGNSFNVHTFVIPVRSMEALGWIRRINQLPQPKIFQNGKYDNFYFLRFNSPVRNWLFDTFDFHHCMYAELPKNLGYIASFYLREVQFWKDEGKNGDLYEYYMYNAKDCWATANSFLSQLQEAPDWAFRNYLIKFGWNFPCLACEVDGIKINQQELERVKREQYAKESKALAAIRIQVGSPFFNPGSSDQVKQLLRVLGNKNVESSDKKALEAAGDRHPLAKRITDGIIDYKKASKLRTTYLEVEQWHEKLLYTLNPSGTDSLRFASKGSQLWCGTQLQNLPAYFKQVLYAEEGYYFGEGDNAQSESRTTGYITGEESLIAALESGKDFHATNAAAFFGLPYQQIIDDDKKAKADLDFTGMTIRDLSKRTNHGASYNMMEKMLLATMGVKNVLKAKVALGLPASFNPLDVTRYLLQRFDATYPKIRSKEKDGYQGWIIAQIKLTKKLVSELGWTRLCFGNPGNSKPNLNTYVSHPPSNLSVHIINEAFAEIYWKIQVKSNGDFRLKGQIHDSIPFIYKIGRLDLVEHAAHLMTRPKVIKDISGKTRTMTIPVDFKGEGVCWRKLKNLAWDGNRLWLPEPKEKTSSNNT